MYTPKQFKEDDLDGLLNLMDEYPFATLITAPDTVPFASHLPLLVERGATVKLVGHLARANEQWRHFESGAQVLVVFHGPHAYVSPSLYETPGVPTWNYAAIHVYGKPRLIMEPEQLKAMVEAFTLKHEQPRALPWQPNYSSALLDHIVGFEMEIERIEGKYKLSQNRSEADRGNLIQILSASDSESARGVAALMQKRQQPR